MIEEIHKLLMKMSPEEKEKLAKLLEEMEKNQNFAPPSDEDFLAALGPCGK